MKDAQQIKKNIIDRLGDISVGWFSLAGFVVSVACIFTYEAHQNAKRSRIVYDQFDTLRVSRTYRDRVQKFHVVSFDKNYEKHDDLFEFQPDVYTKYGMEKGDTIVIKRAMLDGKRKPFYDKVVNNITRERIIKSR